MDSAERHQYLLAMGITPWQERRLDSVQTSGAASEATSVIVAVDWSADQLVVGPDHPAGDLLGNILRAVKLAPEQYRLQQVSDATSLQALAQGAEHVLAFVAGAIDEDNIVALPSLDTMLNDRTKKKVAWDRLKPLVGQL